MKPLTHLQQQIINLILYAPEDLRSLMAQVTNQKYVFAYINQFFPVRTGIEIDTVGIHAGLWGKIHQRYRGRLYNIDIETYGEFPQGNELKFSFTNFRQLQHVKSMLDYLNKEAIIDSNRVCVAENGGLHIHVDLCERASDEKGKAYVKALLPWFNYFKSKVFNYRFDIPNEEDHKVTYGLTAKIAVWRRKQSTEYRMGTPTFDYTKIMRWVLCCQLFTNSMRLNHPFNKRLADAILAS